LAGDGSVKKQELAMDSNHATTDQNRVIIFDTTLRDGEQSPGCSMMPAEKLRIARALADLGVDVIEAGFPAASKGDWDSVHTIAREVKGPIIKSGQPFVTKIWIHHQFLLGRNLVVGSTLSGR
jgi:hypothetical protein